jgi:hypothetical protein
MGHSAMQVVNTELMRLFEAYLMQAEFESLCKGMPKIK